MTRLVVHLLCASLLLLAGGASGFGRKDKEKTTPPPPHPKFHFTVSERLCRTSPDNFDSGTSRFFLVECDPSVKVVTISFRDLDNVNRKQSVYDANFNLMDDITINPQDGIYSNSFRSCDDYSDVSTCDTYKLEVRGGSSTVPFIEWVSFSHTPPEYTGTFDPEKNTMNVMLYSHEPVTVSVRAGTRFFVDSTPPRAESGLVDRSIDFEYLPTAPPGQKDRFTLWVANDDRTIVTNYTFIVDTVTSVNPRLRDISVSPGRMDPVFRPHQYGYFGRIPEGSLTYRLDFAAVNERDTQCQINSGAFTTGTGTAILPFPPGAKSQTVHLKCVAADPSYAVNYVVEVIPQLGGSTSLASLAVHGAELDRPFDSGFSGPYQADLCFQNQKDLKWVAFDAVPFNGRASVTVEGHPVDVGTNRSPYFTVGLGETRRFRIAVRTDANPVEEEYFVDIQRCAHKTETREWADDMAEFFGLGSSIVSAVSGPTFVHNMNFLHWLSFTNRINGNPETYGYFTDKLNTYNMQWDCSKVKMTKYDSGKDNLTFHYHPEDYAHLIDKSAVGYEEFVDIMAQELQIIGTDNKPIFSSLENMRAGVRAVLADLWHEHSSEYEEMAPSFGRRLEQLSKGDKQKLLRKLDAESQVHHKMLQFASSFVITNAVLIIAGIAYVATWSAYLKRSEDAMQLRQDFPLVLHPSKFWTVLLDFALISYTQSTAGLIFLLGKSAKMSVLGLSLTPLRMLVFNIIGLACYPLLYVAAGAFVHSRIRQDNVWSTAFNRHHDRMCFESKARYTLLKWLPIISNFLTIEIKSVAPLSRPADGTSSESRLLFVEERRLEAPWDSSDPKDSEAITAAARTQDGETGGARGGYEALAAEAGSLQYNEGKDRVRVDIDEPRYMENLYDARNADIEKRFPEATLGYNTFTMKNAYDVPVELDVEVQLRHVPPLMQSLDTYTFWVPRSHLQMSALDKWNNLYGLSQRGNFFYWVVDRAAMVLLVLTLSIWQDSYGIIPMCAAGALALCLAGLYVPAAVASGVGKWHRLMANIAADEEKEKLEAKKQEDDAVVWPFEDEQVMARFHDLRARKNDRRWFRSYGLYRVYIKEPVEKFMASPFWRTRAAVTAHEVLFGPVFTEICKFCIMFSALLGNRSIGLYSNRFGSFWCMSMAITGVICLNREAIALFWKQLCIMNYEVFILTRRGVLAIVDFFQDRITPNFLRVRDFTVWNVQLVQNEFGIHAPASVAVAETEKAQYQDSDLLDKRRFHLHKTLYQVRPVGASRPEMDRSLPMCLPLKEMFSADGGKALSRLAGTIQIINHTATRYKRKSDFKHQPDDDSYFSLFTDPQFIPEMGHIRVKRGHGYSVRYDPDLNQLFIRGPGIKEGREYKANPGRSVFDQDGNRSTSSATARSSVHEKGTGTAQEICTEAGVLVVRVPTGQTPSTYHPIEVRSPGRGTTINIDPNQVQVIYDTHTRSLYLRARGLYPSRDPYTVTWRVRNQDVPIRGSGIAHEPGVLVLQLEEEDVPRLDRWITLRDDTGAVLDIDPTQTDRYQVILPSPQLSGFFRVLRGVFSYTANVWHFIVGRHVLRDVAAQPVPCTVVQCTNPLEKTFRVEPNFHDAAKALNAKIEETRAKVDTLDDPSQLGVVCFSVMTSGEFAQFFKSRGVDVEYEGRWINPLMDATHPIFRDKFKTIRDIEPVLRSEVENRFVQRLKALEDESDRIRQWIKAYSSAELYEAQLQRDAADYNDRSDDDIDAHIRKVRALKGEFESHVPGFVYPLTVDSKLLSRRADVEAQIVQWRQQVKQWLLQEENSNRGDVANKVGNSHFECILSEIMRAVIYSFNRQENVNSGMFRSVLHFVCNSKVVRGQDFMWRPDPLCAHPAWVRTWARDDNGRPLFGKDPVWLPCLLKLSGTSIKMLMPHSDDGTRDFYTPHAWKHVTGWYAPLAAFEKVDVVTNSPPPPGAHPYMKTTDTKIVFRKNQQIHVDDNYVRRIEDDHFLNLVQFDSPSTGQRESCLIMIGHCIDKGDATQWPSVEVDPTIVAEDVNVHPLTFRFNSAHAPKWLSAIRANRLANAPEEVDKDFDGKTRESSEVVESEPESSYEYETETTPEETEDEPPPVERGTYKGQFLNNRYHGQGTLRDRDGSVVYEGQWINGERWGKGKCFFQDSRGVKWMYEGNFTQDEPSGDGLLVLSDPKEAERLRDSKVASERDRIIAFKGFFRPPRTVNRHESIPITNDKPKVDNGRLLQLFTAKDKEKGELIIEIPRSISSPPDTSALTNSMGAISTAYAQNDAEAAREEFLPHRVKWVRRLDPTSGYESAIDRITSGTATFADGTMYIGQIANGVPHGKGYMHCYKCPMKYDGEWIEGRPHGAGVMEWAEGDTHHGQFKDGVRSGPGTSLVNNRTIFQQGIFEDDKLVGGFATLRVDPNSPNIASFPYQQYQGMIIQGLPDGEGKLTWMDGATFSGYFSQGLRHGQGTQTDKNGNVMLTGNWEKDLPNGRIQRMILPGGTMYSGDCVKGQRQGMGELFRSEKGKTIYEGLWMNDLPSGRGTLYADDGEFDGEWKSGKRHGKGSFKYKENPLPNGKPRVYEGDWQSDKQHGVGKYLNEHGVNMAYRFERGAITDQSVQAYKPTCGSAPNQGMSPACLDSPVRAVEPEHWGKRRTINTSLIPPMNHSGGGVWARHIGKPFEYCSAAEARAPGPRPSSEVPAGPAGPAPGGRVMSVIVHNGDKLFVPSTSSSSDPYVKVKASKRAKRTVPVTGGSKTPKWEATLKFYYRKTEKLNFEVWDRQTTREDDFLCAGELELPKEVKEDIVTKVHLLRNGQSAGVLNVTVKVDDAAETISHGEVSTVSGPPAPARDLSAISEPQEMTAPHVKVTVHSATNLFNVESSGDMDPYTVIKIGKFAHQTRHRKDGGLNPKFDESFNFLFEEQDKVTFEVFDLEKTKADKLVGTATMALDKTTKFSGDLDLTRAAGEPAGVIKVTVVVNHMEG